MSGAQTEGTVRVGWSHLFTNIGASNGFERVLLALRNIAATNAVIPKRIGPAEKHRSGPFKIPQFINRSRPEAAP